MWIISIPIQVSHSDEEGDVVVVGRKDIRVDGVIPGGRLSEVPGSAPLSVPVPGEEAAGGFSDGLYEGQILTDPERLEVTLGEKPDPETLAVVLPPKGSAVLVSELPPVVPVGVPVGPEPPWGDGPVVSTESDNVLDAPGRFEMLPPALPVELTPGPFEAPLLAPSPPPLLGPFPEASLVEPIPGPPVPGEGCPEGKIVRVVGGQPPSDCPDEATDADCKGSSLMREVDQPDGLTENPGG